ncbi:hypothetical protein MAMT_00184 [Methylacidimicrobium tartarophylax]|uniref:Uncharacterized protein n=2 Tax=Methylacidimicrobium tartarophylax TaxID=1041768 RepID=A0A5E6MA36_9BACT|nr:hypothetical protein MAMT_00184 [Methylacidimicrobium tartarophylax]
MRHLPLFMVKSLRTLAMFIPILLFPLSGSGGTLSPQAQEMAAQLPKLTAADTLRYLHDADPKVLEEVLLSPGGVVDILDPGLRWSPELAKAHKVTYSSDPPLPYEAIGRAYDKIVPYLKELIALATALPAPILRVIEQAVHNLTPEDWEAEDKKYSAVEGNEINETWRYLRNAYEGLEAPHEVVEALDALGPVVFERFHRLSMSEEMRQAMVDEFIQTVSSWGSEKFNQILSNPYGAARFLQAYAVFPIGPANMPPWFSRDLQQFVWKPVFAKALRRLGVSVGLPGGDRIFGLQSEGAADALQSVAGGLHDQRMEDHIIAVENQLRDEVDARGYLD